MRNVWRESLWRRVDGVGIMERCGGSKMHQ